MDVLLKSIIWQQYGAAIDMLADDISLCPDQLWTAVVYKDSNDVRYGQFWFIAYHAIFYIDFYLANSSLQFDPPLPFIRGGLPEKPYSKDQILKYLDQCRIKCQAVIKSLTDEKASQICSYDWVKGSFLEMLLYSMRHVQEHAAQLSLLLGQHDVTGMDWISKARNGDSD